MPERHPLSQPFRDRRDAAAVAMKAASAKKGPMEPVVLRARCGLRAG